MRRYILKRLLWLIPVVLGVCVLVFTIMYFVPGDPASMILGPGASAEELAKKRVELGLDQPFIVRLLMYMRDVFLHGDFGRSYVTGSLITQELFERLPKTLIFGLAAMIIALVAGIPLGVTAAVNQNGWGDRIAMLIATVGTSIPEFWLALMLVILFSLNLGWFPSFGVTHWTGYILPSLALSLGGMAGIARQARSSMLEVIRSDYITTARAKGVSEHDVIYKHALPNAMIPIITIAGTRLAQVFGGSVIIESVFSIPGVGSYMINAVNNRDFPVVEGSVILLAAVFSFIMLVVDIVYAYVDPRIRAQYQSHRGRHHGRHHKKNRGAANG